MDLGFRGEVVELYHRFRRGYPPAVLDSVAAEFGLTDKDIVVDLGCGTGQLTLPMARRVRAVVGVDPEPDMLARARRAAGELGVANVSWVLGSDAEVPALELALGTVGAVTVGQALHWMDHERLFRALASLVRPGGGVAVVSNGTPLWLQESEWSRALRGCLEQWLGTTLDHACGTDTASRQRYRAALTAAGFEVRETGVDYADGLEVEQVIGGIYSALPVDRLPPADQRANLDDAIRQAVEPHRPLHEDVHVGLVLGRRP